MVFVLKDRKGKITTSGVVRASFFGCLPLTFGAKVGCVFLMVVVYMLLHAEIGRNDHREGGPNHSELGGPRKGALASRSDLVRDLKLG